MMEILFVIIMGINVAFDAAFYLQENYRKDKCLSNNELLVEVKHGAYRGNHCISHDKLKELLK